MAANDTPTVAVLGGGIGGLSAAQELAERDFRVAVYEARDRFGGKARSIPVPGTGDLAPESRKALPGEHGFRFFPGFYTHVIDTMARIPYGTNPRGVADNLVPTTQMCMADSGIKNVFPTNLPRTVSGWRDLLRSVLATDPVPDAERRFFVRRLVLFLTSCDRRRREELERISWWDFIDAESMSPAYRKYMGYGVTQSLVAMRPEVSSARTIGRIYLQLLFDLLDPRADADSVLCGPSNDVWIDPWTTYLDDLDVSLHPGHVVEEIHADGDRVTGVTLRGPRGTDLIEADFHVLAMPVEAVSALRSDALVGAAPSLSLVDRLETAWMNGIQFYLATPLTDVHGHGVYLDSPWALTSISQRQFWTDFDPAEYGDGRVEGILSVCISDWDSKGLHGKPACECSPEEVKGEVLTQLRAHIDDEALHDENVIEWFLDPAISFAGGAARNAEPLLINTVRSLRHRPSAATEAENLVLAADYVRTTTDLASMEGANEAARRATNAILDRSGSDAPRCELWGLEEPSIFDPSKRQDRLRYRLGRSHPGDRGRGRGRTAGGHGVRVPFRSLTPRSSSLQSD